MVRVRLRWFLAVVRVSIARWILSFVPTNL